MYKFGRTSRNRLNTCHSDLQMVLNEAILYVDFSIVEGMRTVEKQFEYYQRGRTSIGGIWTVTDRSKIITNIDGIRNKGNHNYNPSLAVDIVPYYKGKADWWDITRFNNIVYFIKGIAISMGIELRIGTDWNGNFTDVDQKLSDLPHMELYRYLNDDGEWVEYV